MKHAREIKVGVLAIVCLGILYFGFNFLKGINIFSPTRYYMGQFEQLNGLTEQAPVYIKGYKVGLVEAIQYDFTRQPAFTVAVSIDKGINLPKGTEMALIPDGLISGMAIELKLPPLTSDNTTTDNCQRGDTLPTTITTGLLDGLQLGLLAHLDSLIQEANDLVTSLNNEMSEGSLRNTLGNIERISRDLTVSSKDIRTLTHNQLPSVVNKADTTISDLQTIVAQVRAAEIQKTLQKLDTTIQTINQVLSSDTGTLGALLNDKTLYDNLNHALGDLDNAVLNVDTVVMSLKAHPLIKKRIPKH